MSDHDRSAIQGHAKPWTRTAAPMMRNAPAAYGYHQWSRWPPNDPIAPRRAIRMRTPSRARRPRCGSEELKTRISPPLLAQLAFLQSEFSARQIRERRETLTMTADFGLVPTNCRCRLGEPPPRRRSTRSLHPLPRDPPQPFPAHREPRANSRRPAARRVEAVAQKVRRRRQ